MAHPSGASSSSKTTPNSPNSFATPSKPCHIGNSPSLTTATSPVTPYPHFIHTLFSSTLASPTSTALLSTKSCAATTAPATLPSSSSPAATIGNSIVWASKPASSSANPSNSPSSSSSCAPTCAKPMLLRPARPPLPVLIAHIASFPDLSPPYPILLCASASNISTSPSCNHHPSSIVLNCMGEATTTSCAVSAAPVRFTHHSTQ